MKFLKASLLALILFVIGYIFYREEIIYLKPTPTPPNFHQPSLGTFASYNTINYIEKNERLKLLHFFNPNCPCSKFNKRHLEQLTREYKGKVDFYAIIEKETENVKDIKFDGNVKIIYDNNKEIAKEFGVYSTPQAIILDPNFRFAFRGNFNKARFCTAKNTQYVKVALDSLLLGKNQFNLPKSAYQAYGCSIY